jgi:hypothetical protein
MTLNVQWFDTWIGCRFRSEHSTHFDYGNDGRTEYSQTDGILVNSGLRNSILAAFVQRYLAPNGNPKPLPRSRAEREENPSDHIPVVVDVSTTPMF